MVSAQPVVLANTDMQALSYTAQQGDLTAKYLLALKYKYGDQIEQDTEIAAQLFLEVAAANYAPAQGHLAEQYYFGDGVKKSYSKAQRYAEQASIAGDALGQYIYGALYERKLIKDIPKEETLSTYQLAAYWYDQSAKKGNADAMVALAKLYDRGRGVDKNKVQAFNWFFQAAKFGHSEGRLEAGIRLFEGEGCTKNYSMSETLLSKVDEKDLTASAKVGLGYFQYQGINQPKDYLKAYQNFTYGARMGSADALAFLAEMYSEGHYVEKDPKKAFGLYLKAAQKGNALSYEKIARLYFNGDGVDKDFGKAFKYFEKAAEHGSANAMKRLAIMKYHGHGVDQDYAQAFFWAYLYQLKSQNDSMVSLVGRNIGEVQKASIAEKARVWIINNKRSGF